MFHHPFEPSWNLLRSLWDVLLIFGYIISPRPFSFICGSQIVSWTEPRPAPREWLLRNVKGANGLCVMMSDKINDEVLDAGKFMLWVYIVFLLNKVEFLVVLISLSMFLRACSWRSASGRIYLQRRFW